MKGSYLFFEWFEYMLRGWKKLVALMVAFILIFISAQFLRGTFNIPIEESPSSNIQVFNVLRFSNPQTYTSTEGNRVYYDYRAIWGRTTNIANFVDIIEDKYEMESFEPDWNNFGDSEKRDWVKQHFKTSILENTSIYEINFYVTPTVTAYDYILDNSISICTDYIEYIGDITSKFTTSADYIIENYSLQVDKPELAPYNIPEGKLLIKYSVIGFIFAVIVYLLAQSFMFILGSKVNFIYAYSAYDGVNSTRLSAGSIIWFVDGLLREKSRNNIITVSSTYSDETYYKDLCCCLTEKNRSIAAVDLTGKIKIENKNAENICDFSISDIYGSNILALADKYDFVVFNVPKPNFAGGDSQYFVHSGNVLLSEKKFISRRDHIEKILSLSKESNVELIWRDGDTKEV